MNDDKDMKKMMKKLITSSGIKAYTLFNVLCANTTDEYWVIKTPNQLAGLIHSDDTDEVKKDLNILANYHLVRVFKVTNSDKLKIEINPKYDKFYPFIRMFN